MWVCVCVCGCGCGWGEFQVGVHVPGTWLECRARYSSLNPEIFQVSDAARFDRACGSSSFIPHQQLN